jgi:long-chain acyl-CoA synthetase
MPLVLFLAKPAVRNQVHRFPDTPVLIVANHITSYDAPFLLYALPGHIRRRVAVAMSGEMILNWRRARNQGNWALNLLAPFEYWLVTGLFNVFPLPQYSGFRRSFAHAQEAVKRGYSVCVFPEGHRSDDGRPQPFKQGAGLLWKQLGTPAIAMRIEGLGELKARGGRWFRSGRITVSARALLPLDPDASPRELTEKLRAAVFE